MRILAIADVEEKLLWGSFNRRRFEGIDLILAAGDLDSDYLEFLVTMLNRPLLYVHGNHDDKLRKSAPGGCICLDDSVYVYQGIRIAGLAGSRKYRDGKYMYTEREMARQIRRIDPQIRLLGGLDILLTHAPERGVGDLEDLPHQGFECFDEFVERWHPRYHIHGHVHANYIPDFKRERVLASGTHVINAYGYATIDVPPASQLSYGWKESWVNRRCLKKSDGLTAQEAGVLGAGHTYFG